MECEFTIENAKMLDKILNTFYYNVLTLNITENTILIQIIQEDKSLICNISLFKDFFKSIVVNEPMTFNISKIRFYKQKMLSLSIKITEFIFSLIWTFETHTHKKELYIADTELYKLEFNPIKTLYVDFYAVYEVLKHFHGKNLEIDFMEDKLKLKVKDNRSETFTVIKIENDMLYKIEMPLHNLKKIFSLLDINEFCQIVFDANNTALNFIIESPEFILSYFAAIYS